MNWVRTRALVLVSWDGQSEPLAMLHLDAAAEFDWLLFDFSGRQAPGPRTLRGLQCQVLSAATECKGEIYQALAEHLAANSEVPEYVALIDDDIILSVSGINRALHLARCENLAVFSPVLSHDSVYTHRWTLRQPNRLFREVDWVEVMMPFYRGSLFMAGREQYRGNTSSWGIDKYLIPTLQKLMGMERCALLDDVMASHRRPVTSGQKVYRNGRTAGQESTLMKAACIALIKTRQPDLLGSDWFRRIFEQRHARSRWQQIKYRIGRPIRQWLDEST